MLKCEVHGEKVERRPMRGNRESLGLGTLVQPVPLPCSEVLWCSQRKGCRNLIKRQLVNSAGQVRCLIENKGEISRKEKGNIAPRILRKAFWWEIEDESDNIGNQSYERSDQNTAAEEPGYQEHCFEAYYQDSDSGQYCLHIVTSRNWMISVCFLCWSMYTSSWKDVYG